MDNPLVEPAQFYRKPEDSEPNEPTEEAEVTTDEPTEQEAEQVEAETDETNESEEEAESDDEDDEETTQYIELDGKEISLDEVREGLQAGLRQKDYTKKTTALSTERKEFDEWRESEREAINQEKSKVAEDRDLLTVLVQEDEEINWAELKEDEPERYIELRERADKRKQALEKVKAERTAPIDDPATIKEEQGKLVAANPEWLDDDGKPTEAFKKDTALMNRYTNSAGFSADEVKQMTRSHYLITILKAAKYDELQEKGRKVRGKREKVPVVPKPKAKTKPESQENDMATQFYGKSNGA